jgi:hypothetical protein
MGQLLSTLRGFVGLTGLASAAILFSQGPAFSQAGSAGGAIGEEDKSISGARSSQQGKSRSTPTNSPRAIGAPSGIQVVSATLGNNCGAPRGNRTSQVAGICNGQDSCTLSGSKVRDPDPAFGCAKAFSVTWRCSAGAPVRSASAAATLYETNSLTLSCR